MERNRSPQSRIKSPFSGPRFVLVLAVIRQPVVQMKAIEQDDLVGDADGGVERDGSSQDARANGDHRKGTPPFQVVDR
jgi:hypothetical protein